MGWFRKKERPDEATRNDAPDGGLSDAEADRLDFNQLVNQGLEGSKLARSALDEMIGLEDPEWEIDLEAHTLKIWGSKFTAEAPVQIIGNYDLNAGTFRWGWDDPVVPPECAVAANRLRAYGNRNRIRPMVKPVIRCADAEAYGYMVLAFRLGPASGALAGPEIEGGDTLTYMTFGKLRLSAAA